MTPHRGRAGALAIAALAAIGCATAPPKPSEQFVWPSPPDPPRIKYLRTYRTPADLDPKSIWERMRRAFVGTDGSLAIFNPTTVALSPDETRLYVACTSTSRVIEVDFAAGTMRLVADAEGHQPKQPFGLATDAEGNLYVADQIDHSVRVFSQAGGFLRELGRNVLERPIGLAIDRRRQVLYVADGGRADDTHHQVEAFALDGRHLRTIGTRGFAPGQFNFPSYLAVSRDGTLYVGDALNFRIQMFDPDGNLVGVFGAGGADVGTFNKMKGLAFDGAGLLHVADAASAWVQMFNAKQQLLLKYGDPGMHDGLMASPNGIAIDSKNNIYVADLAGNRVTQYVLVDTSGAEERPASTPARPEGDAKASASPSPTVAPPVR